MVYIVYRGKKDGQHVFSVKKVGRDTILCAIHQREFFAALWWSVRQAFMYQFTGHSFNG